MHCRCVVGIHGSSSFARTVAYVFHEKIVHYPEEAIGKPLLMCAGSAPYEKHLPPLSPELPAGSSPVGYPYCRCLSHGRDIERLYDI